jgi:hypothetical protein
LEDQYVLTKQQWKRGLKDCQTLSKGKRGWAMTRCTCTVFARSAKLHSHDCAKRKAYEQQHPTPSERRAGKKERIKGMVKALRPAEPHVDKQLMGLLGMKEGKK